MYIFKRKNRKKGVEKKGGEGRKKDIEFQKLS